METTKTLRKLHNPRYLKELEIIQNDNNIKGFLKVLFEPNYIANEIPVFYDDAPYQRGLVWTLEQKQSYILNLFKGLAKITPTIAVYYTEDYTHTIYEVIDGKQRINTIKEYIDNKFPLVVDNEEIYYDNLQLLDKTYFNRLPVKYTRVMSRDKTNKPINQEYILELFIEMNFLGTKMTDDDLKRVEKLRAEL